VLEAALAPVSSTDAITQRVSLARVRVLVVEDQVDAAEFVKQLLKMMELSSSSQRPRPGVRIAPRLS
jgi:hypothetical protein